MGWKAFFARTHTVGHGFRSRPFRGRRLFPAALAAILTVGPALAVGTAGTASALSSNFFDYQNHDVATTTAGLVDWGNNGALTSPAVAGSTWTRAGSQGIFDGGVYNSGSKPPTPPKLTAAGTALLNSGAIQSAAFVADPLSSDSFSCNGTNVSGDPTTFAGAGSETNNGRLSTFTYGASGNTPPKDEISNVYAVAHNAGSTHEIFFGGERVVNNGASHIDFEFLQADLTIPDACKAGTMTGHRTQRDLLLSTDFSNGGGLASADLYTWSCNGRAPGQVGYDASKDFTVCDPPLNGNPGAGDPQYVQITNPGAIGSFGVNTGANGITCGGWVCRNSSGVGTSTLLTDTLMEGGLDLAAAGFNGCINTFLPHTRTSPSFTSVLKDFAGPIAFSNCKTPTVTTSQTAGNSTGANVTATVPASVTDTATLHGAAATVKGSVTYTLFSDSNCTQSVGTSTKTINGTSDGSGDLVLPASDPVTVNAAGTYYWTAAYSGDTNLGGQNNSAMSACGAEVLTAVAPSLSITKTADAAQVSAGDAIGFTVAVTNNGQGTANNTTINDPLPGGPGISWSISPAYAGPGTCSITGAPQTQTLTCSLGALAPAASASVHVTSSTTRASCAVYNNSATVAASNNGTVPPATASVTVQCPTLSITKTADASSVSAGQDIGFTITVHNGGAGTAKAVTLSDPLPTGNGIAWSVDPASGACNITSDTLSCAFGDLASGASASVHVKSPTVFASCATYPNTASAQATNSPSVEASASISVQCPGLQIIKTADAPSVSAGDPIGFAIKVSNTGAGTATGATLADALPSGSGVSWSINPAVQGCSITGSPQTLNCALGNLAPGASVTVHVTSATVAASCGVYPNTATANATNHASVQASASTTVNCPALTINKTADAAVVDAGDNIGFTITVGNTGAGVAKSATLNDPLPAGTGINWAISPAYSGPGTCTINAGTLSCAFGDLAPGATASIHIVSATTVDTPCTIYTNVASAQASNNARVQSSASTTVQCPALHLTKTADAPSVNAGDPIGFTITVSNTGVGNAKGVTIADALPFGSGVDWSIVPANAACSIAGSAPNQVLNCSFGTLAPNASASVHVTSATVRASCGTYPNTALAAASNAPSAVAIASTTVNCPNLVIDKTADSSAVSSGSPIGFTITVGNTGPGVATAVTLNDPLPGGAGITWSMTPPVNGCSILGSPPNQTLSCSFGDMAAGALHAVHVSSPTSAATPCADYPNTATAQATNNPPVQHSATTSVQCPGLNITKEADAPTVSAGDAIGFTITVSNTGAGTAANVTLNDPLPSGSGVSWAMSPAVPGCSIAGSPQVLSCSFGDMAPQVSHSVHVTSATTFASCAIYPNTATASDDNSASVQASASTTVNCPNVTITKTADAPSVSAGTAIGFTITVSNSGAGTAKNVDVTDPLPVGTGIVWSISPAVAGCDVTAGALHCGFGDLAPGTSRSVHITSPTTFASCATYPNTATATATNHPEVVANAATIVLCPNLSITKTADATPVSTGDPIGFLVTVSNSNASGTGTATAVTLNDPLPSGNGISWTISPAYAGPGTCAINGSAPNQTLVCSFGDLARGASVSVHIASATTAASAGTYPNTATASASNHPPVDASATIDVLAPALSITKAADATPVNTGDPIGFSITVNNSAAAGTGTAKAVTLNDPLPAGNGISWTINPDYSGPGTCAVNGSAPTQTLVCSFGDLAPGASVSVHIASATTAASAGTYPNTATASASNTGSVEASATIVVVAPNLTITKTADAGTVNAGSSIGFTLTVGNTGPGTARSVTLDDPLPAGNGIAWAISPAYAGVGTCTVNGSVPTQTLQCSFGDLGAGASATVHVMSSTAFASCAQYPNTATASTTNGTSIEANATTTVQCPALQLTKQADNDTVSAGSAIGFTIQVSNTGPGTATGVTVTDPLPTGTGINWSVDGATPGCSVLSGTLTCAFGNLDANTSRSVHITSPTVFASCAEYPNAATAAATNHPVVEAHATTTVECPDLSVTKTADATPVNTGDPIGFTVTVSNAGPGTAVDVTLNDPLPAGNGVVWSIDPANAACHINGSAPAQTLACAFGDLAAEASASVHIVSATTAASGGTYDNTATAAADNAPSVEASATVVVLPPALNITKVADDPQVDAGAKIGFTVTVSNSDAEGTGIARAVTLSDPLPGGNGVNWSIDPAYSGPGTCSIAGAAPAQTLGCSFGDMAPGASASIHVASATTTGSIGRYDNTAVAATTNGSSVHADATTSVIADSPVTVASVPPTTTTTVAPAPAELPFTGGDAARLALVGLFLVATGTALFLSRRRRPLGN